MDDETKAAFARMDHWFQLLHAQHVGWREDLSQEIGSVREDLGREIGSLRQEIGSLRQDFERRFQTMEVTHAQFRDWSSAQFSDVRGAIRQLSRRLEGHTG